MQLTLDGLAVSCEALPSFASLATRSSGLFATPPPVVVERPPGIFGQLGRSEPPPSPQREATRVTDPDGDAIVLDLTDTALRPSVRLRQLSERVPPVAASAWSVARGV